MNFRDFTKPYKKSMELPSEWSIRCFQPSLNRTLFARYAKDKAGSVKVENVTLERRIGSKSMNAVVYEGSVDGRRVAVKFMPRTFRDEWDREVAVATALSDLVLKDASEPFPIVLGSGTTIIKLPPSFPGAARASQETARINAVAQGKSRREALLAARTAPLTENVHARYLISELAKSDLASVINPSDYHEQMKCALSALHAAGYVHGDAHLGNFLLTPNDAVLIHDFGDTIKTNNADARADDFAKLEDALARAS